MKIKYEFADGTVSEVEVDDELGLSIKAIEKEFENYERKQRYHGHISLDSCDYEGEWFADPNPTQLEQLLLDEQREDQETRVQEFYKTLTPIQLRRLHMLEQGMTQRKIAAIEGVNLNAVQKSIEQIRKKHEEYFNK